MELNIINHHDEPTFKTYNMGITSTGVPHDWG